MKENFAENNLVYLPKIKIIGAGGCGVNSASYFAENNPQNIEIFGIYSDKEFLENSKLDENHKIQIGEEVTFGLGCGGICTIGEKAAEISVDKIEKIVDGADIVFIIAGTGGGFGSGSVPVISKIAKDKDALVIVFAVTPADFEGKRHRQNSDKCLEKLVQTADLVINVANQRFKLICDKKMTVQEMFNMINTEIINCINGIINIFDVSGSIYISFDSFKKFVANSGFGGIGISKKYRLEEKESAIGEVLSYFLIKNSFEYAQKEVIYIRCGNETALQDINDIFKELSSEINENIQVLFGVKFGEKDFADDEFQITIMTM